MLPVEPGSFLSRPEQGVVRSPSGYPRRGPARPFRAERRAAGSVVAEGRSETKGRLVFGAPGDSEPTLSSWIACPYNGSRFCCGACGGSRAAPKQKIERGCRLANAPSAASAG